MANAQELYEQALEAIDSGDTRRGMDLLQQSLEQDSYNLDGWVKLVEIMPDNDVKYDVLEQILQLDPNNDFANSEWDRLNALADAGQLGADTGTMPVDVEPEPAAIASDMDFMDALNDDFGEADAKPAAKKSQEMTKPKIEMPSMPSVKIPSVSSLGSIDLNDEIVPGITNRDVAVVGGGLLLFTIVMFIISSTIINSAHRRVANIQAAETQRYVDQTATLDANATNIVSTMQASTQMAFDLTQTMESLVSPTPTQRAGLVNATEVPPTPTEEPTTLASSRAFSAPPVTLPGNLLAWGGINPGSRTYLYLYRVDPGSSDVLQLNDETVNSVSVDTVGSRIVYMRYRVDTNSAVMDLISSDNPRAFPEIMDLNFGSVSDLENPSLASTGNYLAFTGITQATGTRDVYLWDFLNEEVIQLSNDASTYRSVAVSAAGNKVVAVRENGNSIDLVMFDRDSAPEGQAALQILLTNDDAGVVESDIEFSTDGARILYSASVNGSSNIVMLELATFEVTPLITIENSNEILPHFSPDNRYVVFSANPTGTYNIFILDTISQQIFQVTESNREPMFVAGWYN